MQHFTHQRLILRWAFSLVLGLISCKLSAQMPYLLKDIQPGDIPDNGGIFRGWGAIGDTAYFMNYTLADEDELWMADASGTAKMLKQIMPQPSFSNPVGAGFFTKFGGATYFLVAEDATNLWKTDGTVAGTQRVFDFGQANCKTLHLLGNQLILIVEDPNGWEVWTSDGTTPGTVLGATLSHFPYSGTYATDGQSLFFPGSVGGEVELLKTDGTITGTGRVADIYPGGNESVGNLQFFGGEIWFTATDGVHGIEVWHTDGTAQGTVMLDDYLPGPGDGVDKSEPLLAADGYLYWVSDDGGAQHGKEIRRSDGMLGGTVVLDVVIGVAGSEPTELAGTSKRIYFNEQLTGRMYSASAAGLAALQPLGLSQLPPTGAISKGDSLYYRDQNYGVVVLGDTMTTPGRLNSPGGSLMVSTMLTSSTAVYFVGYEFPLGQQLYRIDGGALTRLTTFRFRESSDPVRLTSFGNKVLFNAWQDSTGVELWTTDGTPQGTQMVKDAAPGQQSLAVAAFSQWNGVAYFSAFLQGSGTELWRTDGTSNGTYMVKDIWPGPEGSNPGGFFQFGNHLYFIARDSITGIEVWRTDGTSQGTVLFHEFTPNAFHSWQTEIIGKVNGKLILRGFSGPGQVSVIATNGTSQATTFLLAHNNVQNMPPADATNYAGRLYFVSGDNDRPLIYYTDGTGLGTGTVTGSYDMAGNFDPILGILDGKLMLNMVDSTYGSELWQTNGTQASLFMDLVPGLADGFPRFVAADSSGFFFTASSPAGRVVWTSDGTLQGTGPVGNGSPSSPGFAYEAVLLNGVLYYESMSLS